MENRNINELVDLLKKLKTEYLKSVEQGNNEQAQKIKQQMEKLVAYIKKVKEEEKKAGYTQMLDDINKEEYMSVDGDSVQNIDLTKEIQKTPTPNETSNKQTSEQPKEVKEQPKEQPVAVEEVKEQQVVVEKPKEEQVVVEEVKEQPKEEPVVVEEVKEQPKEQQVAVEEVVEENQQQSNVKSLQDIQQEMKGLNLSPKQELKYLKQKTKEREKEIKREKKLNKKRSVQSKKANKLSVKQNKKAKKKAEVEDRKKRKAAQKMEVKSGTIIMFLLVLIVFILGISRGGIIQIANNLSITDRTTDYIEMFSTFIRIYIVLVLVIFLIYSSVAYELRHTAILRLTTITGLLLMFISFNGLSIVGINIKALEGQNYLIVPGIFLIFSLHYLIKNFVRDKVMIDYEFEIEE